MPGFNILYEEPSNAIWQTFLSWPRRQGDTFISVSIEVGLAQVPKSRHFDLDIPRARPGPTGNFLWQWPCLLLLLWYNTESSLGRRGFTWLTDPSTGKASEDSRAGTEGRPQKAAAYWVVSESLSYTSSQDLHRVIPPQQAGTLYIYQQSRNLLTCQSDGGGSVTEIPSSQISLALCQADKNKLTSRNLYFLTTHFFTGHLYNA